MTKFSDNQRDAYSKVIPEYLFYCNMGRGDLIYFDSWKSEFIDLNEIPNLENFQEPI